ncbi:Copper amine oxidase N-terminal domain-containing protein [Paenibacillus jilunlii]|uniref:Copper amine oxidase N-terminal domain-containing protein n=3 Tax=Paenibacillus jilunlii TaxID=682956 RepID=A0A1G9VIV8_9BACL|nr:Copper amine oxidase N-terminal domain-containing protein [Paenibacillus jilunlii]
MEMLRHIQRNNRSPMEAQITVSRMLRCGLCTLLGVLLLLAWLPIREAQAAEQKLLQLSLKPGSTAATVNGEKAVIQKPIEDNGVVLVPLGVFKKAFGSTVSLDGDDVVKVMYGPHTGAMTIGSTTAWKDGVKVTLPAPPRIVDGTLLVPLRFVAGVLGARISPVSGGGLVVTLASSASDEDTPETSGIDSDVGKTRIGNSYYHWSLNYPPGLVVGDSGGNESVATFTSAENQYYLEVHALPLEKAADPEELLDRLVREAEEGGETVLDRAAFPDEAVPYARIVSKDTSGALWEGRQYYSGGILYQLYLTDDTAANYKDLNKYASLLNSFQPSFNAGDKSIRDLSTVKNGLREGYNDDYGLSLQVPADWSMDDQHLNYESTEGSYLRAKVTSVPSGSTLESWSKDLDSQIKDTYVTGAYAIQDAVKAEVSGEPALVKETRLNPGSGWSTKYQILLQKSGYRYYVEYLAAAGQDEDKARFQTILSSIDIDFDRVKENFGKLETEDYPALRSQAVTKSSKTYGYSIDIPRLWTPYQDVFETQTVEYRFTGGRFLINTSPEGSVDYAVGLLQSYYKNSKNDPKGPQLIKVEETTFAGVPATLLTVRQTKGSIPVQTQQVVFGNNDLVYTLTVTLNDANATAVQQADLEKTLKSFRLAGGE